MKIGTLVGVHDVIIQSKFGFNILRGFRSTGGGGRNFHFPIDFAGHRYNSAAATAQPVMGPTPFYGAMAEKPPFCHKSKRIYVALAPYIR